MEIRYVAHNYPGPGDIVYFDYVRCTQCNHPVHAYQYQYFRKSALTEVFISDKDNRHIFQSFIESGQAFIVPPGHDNFHRNYRAMVLASQYTLQTILPADITAYYLSENDKAPWVSNKSIIDLEQKRERWLAEYAERGMGEQIIFSRLQMIVFVIMSSLMVIPAILGVFL